MTGIVHLLDDFGMGGVTRALTLFQEPAIRDLAHSRVEGFNPSHRIAPKLDAAIIVNHIPFSWARLPFLLSLRMRNPRAKIVHVEHTYSPCFEAIMVGAPNRFHALLRLGTKMVDAFVCVSEAQKEWALSAVGLPEDKVRVIYPWTDRTELFGIEPIGPVGKRPIRLLAYGRYASIKNFEQLIVAMRSFDPAEVRLIIFGAGPDRADLIRLASDLPHVDVRGPSPDPGSFLAECDAVIIPSRCEAFGLVATEARMAARALIVADVDGLPEQARKGGGIVAPMGSACDIARAISHARTQDLASLGRMARQGVASQSSGIISAWSELITAVAPRSRPASLLASGRGNG